MTFAPSNVLEAVRYELGEIAAIATISDGIRVTTHCMYPSNGLVQVSVRGGARTLIASDDGGAVGEALSAGISAVSDRSLLHLVRDQGLSVKEGVIYSPQLPFDAAAVAVLQVANASRSVAEWLYEHSRIRPSRDFRVLLAEFLERTFDDKVEHDAVIVGASNKAHRFANVLSLESGQRLIVDPVTPEASSINARVVANLDVKAAGHRSLLQRIVYDDTDKWTPADLNLLQVGAFVVPYSQSQDVIRRLASGAQAI